MITCKSISQEKEFVNIKIKFDNDVNNNLNLQCYRLIIDATRDEENELKLNLKFTFRESEYEKFFNNKNIKNEDLMDIEFLPFSTFNTPNSYLYSCYNCNVLKTKRINKEWIVECECEKYTIDKKKKNEKATVK